MARVYIAPTGGAAVVSMYASVQFSALCESDNCKFSACVNLKLQTIDCPRARTWARRWPCAGAVLAGDQAGEATQKLSQQS